MARKTIAAFKRDVARRLRHHSTQAEALLWRRLKRLEIQGTHFRRQMPIGNYIVDFACPAAHLIVEVDGSQHGSEPGRSRDNQRTAWLNSEGYRLLRVWNNDVTRDIDAVMELIYAELNSGSHSDTRAFRHQRRRNDEEPRTPPRRARRADPPPPGEG